MPQKLGSPCCGFLACPGLQRPALQSCPTLQRGHCHGARGQGGDSPGRESLQPTASSPQTVLYHLRAHPHHMASLCRATSLCPVPLNGPQDSPGRRLGPSEPVLSPAWRSNTSILLWAIRVPHPGEPQVLRLCSLTGTSGPPALAQDPALSVERRRCGVTTPHASPQDVLWRPAAPATCDRFFAWGPFPPKGHGLTLGSGGPTHPVLLSSWTSHSLPHCLPAQGRFSQDDSCKWPPSQVPQSGAHCPRSLAEGAPHGAPGAGMADPWARRKEPAPAGLAAPRCCLLPPRANAALLHDFWCQPASRLPREQLSALIRSLASQHIPLRAWQLSCLANLASRLGLQEDFALHPPDLLLFYNLSQVRKAECQAFTHRATQGNTELLANLPDQRAALQHKAFSCLGAPPLQLSAANLGLLGILVCDMDASSIVAADPHVLWNLLRCPRLTAAQRAALNSLLASGRTPLGLPNSWNLEGLQALGTLATHISPHLWEQVPEATGLDFFRSTAAAYRARQLSQRDTQRFVTSFLEAKASSMSWRPKRGTGQSCAHGDITAATLRDDLFLLHYDCIQLEACLSGRVLRTNLHPLLQHPLPAECQRVVKTKLGQVYPYGVPENQLRLISSLVYLYTRAEISLWNITSGDTVVALLASDVALENQTEAVVQRFLDHNGTVTGALLVAIGGSRLCWMSPQQIQNIRPAEFRLAGILDTSPCPQSQKDALFSKAHEAFSSTQTSAADYYHLIRPYLGGAPVEELQHLAEAHISMDIDTFANLNPSVLQRLSVDDVTTLLGQNVRDLQKAHSHPTITSWLRGLNSSALGNLGLDTNLTSPTLACTACAPHGTAAPAPHLPTHSGQAATTEAHTSGSPLIHAGHLPLAVALPSSLLWLLLHWASPGMVGIDQRAPEPWSPRTALIPAASVHTQAAATVGNKAHSWEASEHSYWPGAALAPLRQQREG
ncbi:mesothelin-like protein [Ctenodactylus gundi]